MKARYLIAAMPILLSACDSISGVRTEAKLDKQVDVECVDRTLRNVGGIGPIAHRIDRHESYQISPPRGNVINIIDQWAYGPNQIAALQIADDGHERTYFNGMQKMGEPWPSTKLDAFVPLMVKVNAAMEKECGLPLRANGHITRN